MIQVLQVMGMMAHRMQMDEVAGRNPAVVAVRLQMKAVMMVMLKDHLAVETEGKESIPAEVVMILVMILRVLMAAGLIRQTPQPT